VLITIVIISLAMTKFKLLIKLMPKTIKTELDFLCNIANSLNFNFTKKGLKVNVEKIDLSLLKMGK
jgi:hypothetical protein